MEGRRDAVPAVLDLATSRRACRRIPHPRHAGHRAGPAQAASYETSEGDKRTVVELDVDEVGPSLRYATAKVNRSQRASDEAPADDPWTQEPVSAATG
jgi:hypothetical protein